MSSNYSKGSGMSRKKILISLAALAVVGLVFLVYSVRADGYIRPSNLQIELKKVGSGFQLPLFLTNAGDGSGRMFIVEKRGTIRLLKDGVPSEKAFLDITPLVNSVENERGLLGLAFHPDYKTNGLFFVYYTGDGGQLTVARYKVSATDPDTADPASAKILLTVNHARGNHNGGMLVFGPDGYLYIGMGDGGGAGDPDLNGQNPKTLLGKLLRIDVNKGDPYAIPSDNPFADGVNGAKEVWAYGLRNPWRFSFDQLNGDLYIGDVGQDNYEEVDYLPAGSKGGTNFGWNVIEGNHCYNASSCNTGGFTPPVLEYEHTFGCSITGGYVYHGGAFPNFQGYYFFSDYCTGRLWVTQKPASGDWTMATASSTGKAVSGFGQDEIGELYLLDYNSGDVFQITDRTQS